MIRVRLSGFITCLDGLAFLLLGFLDALWISVILGWRELLLQSFLPARHGLKRTFGQGPVAIQPWIVHGLEKQFLKFRVCETPSVLTKVPCSSHDMDAHPFTRVMSGLTKGWAAVRDLSHRGKGIGCLCGGLVGEAAINIGSGAAW